MINDIKFMSSKDKTPRRIRHIDYRVTADEYNQITEKARSCGITKGEYSRRCALDHKPKLHLTEREVDAFCSLADARGDLVHIRSALKGKSQEQIKRYFNDERFMRTWIQMVTNIIIQWDNIIEQMKE